MKDKYARWSRNCPFYIFYDRERSNPGDKGRQYLSVSYSNKTAYYNYIDLCEMVEKQDFSKIVGYDEVESREQRTVRNAIDDFIKDVNAETLSTLQVGEDDFDKFNDKERVNLSKNFYEIAMVFLHSESIPKKRRIELCQPFLVTSIAILPSDKSKEAMEAILADLEPTKH